MPPSLADVRRLRDRRATPPAPPAQPPAKRGRGEEIFFPLGLLEGLEGCDLMRLSGADRQRVHACMVDMLTLERRRPQSGTPLSASPCGECGTGRTLVDEREGTIFCEHCGAVRELMMKHQPSCGEANEARTGRAKSVSGVPRWMLARSEYTENYSTYRLLQDLEHWSHYAGMQPGSDAVALARRRLLYDSISPATPNLVRVVAALLIPAVEKQVDIASLQRGAPVPRLSFGTKPPRLSCPRGCGARFHAEFEARRHRCMAPPPLKRSAHGLNRSGASA